MEGAKGERLENQEIECALKELSFGIHRKAAKNADTLTVDNKMWGLLSNVKVS
jgi:hypothetical protein